MGHQNPLEYFLNRDASPRGHPYVLTCCTYLPVEIGRWGPDGWGRRRPRLEDLDPEEVGLEDLDIEGTGVDAEQNLADIRRVLLEADANDGVDYTRHIGAITSGTRHQASTRRLNSAKVGEKRAAISHGDDELSNRGEERDRQPRGHMRCREQLLCLGIHRQGMSGVRVSHRPRPSE